jgi:ABC-type polysaccharide/polyol phosphate transport system ATPase subunit
MSRAEIRRKFDEIVDFAEVEKFLDTPVKRYSSLNAIINQSLECKGG